MKDFFQNFLRFFVFFFMDFIYRLIFPTKAIGVENIPKKGGVILAPNHISGWDVFLPPYFALGRFSSRQFYSAAKEELFKFPPLGVLLKLLRNLPVRRGKQDYAAMNRISEVATKHMVMLYPEGTRSKDGKLGPGRPGVGKIIRSSRAAVIPIVIFNTNYCTPGGSWIPNLFQRLYIVFGKPLNLEKYYAMKESKETSRLIANYLMEEIAKLKEEYRHLDKAPEWARKRTEASYREYARKRDEGSGS